MKTKLKGFIALAAAACMSLGFAACGENGDKTKVADDIVNGSFEEVAEGQWVGWTRKDAAFNFRGVTNQEKVNGVVMEKAGEYYFAGTVGGNPAMRGTLTSDPFKLGGNGFISFKMGGGKNKEKCYVEFFVSGQEAAVAKVTNDDCDGMFISDHLITKVVDLSAYVGKTITIVATDNDDGDDVSWLNLDDFRVLTSDAEVAAAKAEHDKQIAEFGEKPFEEDETSTSIQNGGFETGDLTGWKVLEGKAFSRMAIVPTSQYYWTDRAVYGEGEYYFDGNNNGAIQESYMGSMRSTKFTLGGDGFITFMLGAGNGAESYIALCDANTDEELLKQDNSYFSDPARALMLLRYYMDAHEYIGRVCYMKVVDGRESGFGFINVDDVRVSMTQEEVAALQVEQIEKVEVETYTSASYKDLDTIRDYYAKYPYLVALESLTMTNYAANVVVDCGTVNVTELVKDASASFGSKVIPCTVKKVVFGETEITSGFEAVNMSEAGFYTVTYGASYQGKDVEGRITVVATNDKNAVVNGGFESGNLAGWTVLTDGWAVTAGQPGGVISATSYWGEELPYNQSGNFHLDGWNTGIGEGDPWAIRSTKFTLAGSGFISVKMGGNAAAVKVFKADGTQIGYYKQTRFADANFPHVGLGGSWADMGTYVIDLSEYVGQELYIELHDEKIDAGWAHGFFDEVVTYYATAPDYANLSDTVMDGHTGDETASEISIPWRLATNLL